ncbi:PAAR domain-containing protein [Spartinivicinus marinus]
MPETHAGVTSSGSPNHIINGKPVARVGDSVSCGSTIATGEALHTVDR